MNGSRNFSGDKVSQFTELRGVVSVFKLSSTQPQKSIMKNQITWMIITIWWKKFHMTWLHFFYNKATKVTLFTSALPQSVILQTSVWADWRGMVLCGSITVSLLIAVLCRLWNIDFIVSHLMIVTADESEQCNSILRGSWIIQTCY